MRWGELSLREKAIYLILQRAAISTRYAEIYTEMIMIHNSGLTENSGEIPVNEADGSAHYVTSIEVLPDPADMPVIVPAWIKGVRNNIYLAFGGFPGKHNARRPRFFSSTRILLLVTVFALALAWLLKQGCLQQVAVNNVLYLFTGGNRSFIAMCYTNLTLDFQDAQGFAMQFPFWPGVHLHPQIEQNPPLIKIGLFLIITLAKFLYPALSWLGLPIGIPVVFFFGVFAVITAGLWISIVFMVRALLPYEEYASTLICYLLALSPIAILQVYTSFEVFPVFCAVLALFLLERNRPYAAGVILALGVLSSLSCLIIMLAAGAMWWKTKEERFAKFFGMSAQSIFILFAILFFANYRQLFTTYSMMFRARDDMDSLYTAFQNLIGYALDEPHAAMIINSMIGILGFFLLIWVGLVVKFADSVTIYQIAVLLMAGFLAIGKMFKPEFSLWILPLVILACPYTRLVTVWMCFEGIAWFMRCGTLLSRTDYRGLTEQFYGLIALIRIILIICILMAMALHILRLTIVIKHKRICLVNQLPPL